jgi:aspartyl protease family protein
MPFCAYHPANQAATTCLDCLKPVCTACYRYEGGRDLCPACIAKVLRARRVRKTILAIVLAGVFGGAAWLVATMESPFRYGPRSSEVRELRRRLERQPCDAGAAVQLGDLLIEAGASDEVEPMAQAFTARCGRQTQLLWKVYEAAKRTGQWTRALAVATELIEHDPADKDYWWWRGVVHEQLGHDDEALADYKQTIAVQPNIDAIPFNVANVYERLKRPCEAALAIEQFLFWHPEHRDELGIRMRLERLYREGRCGESVKGKATIRFPPSSPVIAAEAVVNGRKGRFLVDTGASVVVLSRAFGARIGLSPSPGGSVQVATANGVITAHLVRLDAVSLQGVSASGVEAALVDRLPADIDGLIGLSFLARFEMALDAREGRLELAARGQ